MKRIPLTQGQFAIVDDEDYVRLYQYKWRASWHKHTQSFYAVRKSKTKNGKNHTISMAREILGLSRDDKRQADHIDHNTLDNRKSELRIVTRSGNQWNRKNPKGYYFHKANHKYLARIGLNGKGIYLGFFCKAKEAHNAYLKAKKYYHNI